MLKNLHIVIMAGGKGTRFWPLSRSIKAKQFLDIIDNTPLLELTISRIKNLVPQENIWIVGNKEQSKYLNTYEKLIPAKNILIEPEGKNTAPCITWAAGEVYKENKDSIMAILPADHYIADIESYQNTLKEAYNFVIKNNCLMTIGVQPTYPHTGYGYIETDNSSATISKVSCFKEKPDLETAKNYLEKGSFFWNSGQFIWKTATILTLIEKHLPEIAKTGTEILKLDPATPEYTGNLKKLYSQFPSISIDYGIMEKAYNETYMIKANFDWNDIGNWNALEKYWPKDSENKNSYQGNLLTVDSQNNIIYSPKRLVSLVGVENMVVVDTDDALLIMSKADDQKIKNLYEQLPEQYK